MNSNGQTIAFRNPVQALLFNDFLKPELAKGHWASAYPHNHHKDWHDAVVAVDESGKALGVAFSPTKNNYDLLNKDFVDSIGDKAIKRVKTKVGAELTMRDLRRELKDMMFIMRTPAGKPLATSHQGLMARPGRPSKTDLEGLLGQARATKAAAKVAKAKATTKAAAKGAGKDIASRRLAGLEKARAAKAAKRAGSAVQAA